MNLGIRRAMFAAIGVLATSASAQTTLPAGGSLTVTCSSAPLPAPAPAPAPTPPLPPPPPPIVPPAPIPAPGLLLQEGFEGGGKGSFDWDADGRTSYVHADCHSGTGCGAKTVSSSGNQQRVFWERDFGDVRPGSSYYFGAWWKFPVGYTWDEATGTDPFGWEHKMMIADVAGGTGRMLLNLRGKGASPELAIYFESTEDAFWTAHGFTGVHWPTDGTWHHLELQVDRATNGRAQIWLDGARVLDVNGPTCGGGCGSVAVVKAGAFVNQGARVTEMFYMDDIAIGTSRP